MKKNIQEQLDELYQNVLTKDRLKKDFPENIRNKISAPHLLNIHENYEQSQYKILYIGKETNKWWGKLEDFINSPNAINLLKQRYNAKFFGGSVLNGKNKLTTYKGAKFSTPFWTQYKKINDKLLNSELGSLPWVNLLKMDLDINKGYSRNAKSNPQIVQLSKEILLKELEILKPDYIIFTTGYKYDNVIKVIFEDLISDSEVIESRSFWKFKINDIQCFRTWHPSTIRYKALKNKFEYYDDIVAQIEK